MCSPRYPMGWLESTCRSNTNPSIHGPSMCSGWISTTATSSTPALASRFGLRLARKHHDHGSAVDANTAEGVFQVHRVEPTLAGDDPLGWAGAGRRPGQ